MVTGVTEGFKKNLEINGVGYRAQMQGKTLKLAARLQPRRRLSRSRTASPIKCRAADRDRDRRRRQAAVGQVAAEIRAFRPPEPYKGKGIKYADEYILRKEGKKK